MKTANRGVIVFASAALSVVCLVGVSGQELSAEAKEKAAAEAKAKRDALTFENNARTIVFYDRSGKRTGSLGERELYRKAVMSPDRSRVAIFKSDLANESGDVFVLDVATGASTRLTTSARTEWVSAPVWSPDSSRIAYVAMRKGQEGIYVRPSIGQGPEELLYKNPSAFLNLSDWSSDGRFLTFAMSDMSGGRLFTLPLEGGADRKPAEIFRSELQIFDPRFSPDGRFLSYLMVDKANRGEVFVRPVDPAASGGPWQISEGSFALDVRPVPLRGAFWRGDGRELYYLARDQAVMVAEVSTSPTFSFTKPKVLFRQESNVPDRLAFVSADGERFLAFPPPRSQQLQQITIFNRQGEPVQKVGEPGLYSSPSFSPDAARLLVKKNDLQTGQADLWTIDLATGTNTRITNDTFPKENSVWSADGKYIYYSSFRNEDFPVHRRASDGSGDEELVFSYTPGAFVAVSDISPDGKILVCNSGGTILFVPLTGDLAARKEIEFLREEFFDGFGRLSPDGRFMAFLSDETRPEGGEVYVRTIDAARSQPGDGKWRVSTAGAAGVPGDDFNFAAMLHWRADGKELFFRGLNLEANELLMMSVDVATSPTFTAAAPKLLFKLPGPIGNTLGNISRDGQRFVFAVNVPAAGTR
jgi:Tol biopolymer transport system component